MMREIILASKSPRRAELLRQMGIKFRVVGSGLKEEEASFPFREGVQQLAYLKAEAVLKTEKVFSSTQGIILAADTIVVKNGQVLGKPADKHEAAQMLTFLSGDVHEVMTGICIINQETGQVWREVEITRVYFRSLTDGEIKAYVASGEPLDKAGAYGIQGLGGLLVEKIDGCYYNVVGLPLVKTMQLLRNCGIKILGGGR